LKKIFHGYPFFVEFLIIRKDAMFLTSSHEFLQMRFSQSKVFVFVFFVFFVVKKIWLRLCCATIFVV